MIVTAHSGCEGTPDNSLSFIDYALRLPVQALEVDVWQDEAGALILSHDKPTASGDSRPVPTTSSISSATADISAATVSGSASAASDIAAASPTGAFADSASSAIPAPYPALDEALSRLARHPSMLLNCDLKQGGLEDAVIALAARRGLERCLLFSGEVALDFPARHPAFAGQALLNIEHLLVDLYEQLSGGEVLADTRAAALVRECRARGFRLLNVDFHICTDGLVRAAAQSGVGLSFWTVDRPQDIRRVLALSPYNITSRQPQRVLAAQAEIQAH